MTNPAQPTNRFGPYLVQEKLGTGGMAVVYRALNEETGATVALKILRSSLSEQTEVVERFKREATITKRLSHPYIVPVYNYGSLKGRFYLEMAYMPRGTLKERFKVASEISPQVTIRLLRGVSSALDYAHQHGVIHRDLKLENILINDRGEALLSDFGIARVLQEASLTATGSIIGTPLYIPPEQAMGDKIDHRADLYSLAVIVYLLAVGHFPFTADNVAIVIHQHITQEPPLPSRVNANLPTALDAVLLKGLAKRPEARYASADAFIEAFARIFTEQMKRNTVVDIWSDYTGKTIPYRELQPVTKSADEWVQEAQVAANRDEAIRCLRKALELEPLHSKANRLLLQLEAMPLPSSDSSPSRPNLNREELRALKKVRPVSKGSNWSGMWLGAWLLLSLTILFFVLSLIGSPFTGPITALLKGQRQPVLDINGTPIHRVPGFILTVEPSQSKSIKLNQSPTSDTLDVGISHEYTINVVNRYRPLYIYIQFFSPSAQNVISNVAMLRPDGLDAQSNCPLDNVTTTRQNVTFVCNVIQPGVWKVRIFGITGQSTGVYFISASQG